MTSLQPKKILKNAVFLLLGAAVTSALFAVSFVLVFYLTFQNKIYPGIRVGTVDLSGLTHDEARNRLREKYRLTNISWQFDYLDRSWRFSNHDLRLDLATDQSIKFAYATGRNPNPIRSIREIWNAYWYGRFSPLEVTWNSSDRANFLSLLRPEIDIAPIEGQFKFEPGLGADGKGRVVAFTPSRPGQTLDAKALETDIKNRSLSVLESGFTSTIQLPVPVKVVEPNLTSEKINSRGIVDVLGVGESYFYDSIPGRVHNISIGTEKINGSLLAPGEVFSFNQAIGTVSAVFGFQKAYAILNGKTVLDDGGGVCQVSTTLYRAVINSGLPVIEREPHTYRVGFYEQGGFLPGLDATVYPPSPDFRFRNDTQNWILIQTDFNQSTSKLTFELYGKSDGRVTDVSKPVIMSTSPAPEPVYEDDPTLPNGQVKQVDKPHAGAKVYYTRKVTRGDEVLIDEKVSTSYIPWPARFLRGTKVN